MRNLYELLKTGSGFGVLPAPAVESVFASAPYVGNGGAVTVKNKVDLASKGGLVWIKNRGLSSAHYLADTLVPGSYMTTTTTAAASAALGALTANSDGFTTSATASTIINSASYNYASWTFARSKRFFDIIRYTGDDTNDRSIPHNLGVTPGLVIVKNLSTGDWVGGHISFTSSPGVGYILFNNSAAFVSTSPPSRVQFDSANLYVHQSGTPWIENAAGNNYVAYLFAHDTASDGIIQCGSYVGNGVIDGPSVTLGWDPQYLMIKRRDAVGDWVMIDTARGFGVGGSDDSSLLSDATGAEAANGTYAAPTISGFKIESTSTLVNAVNGTYIYMAIRRPAARVPVAGTEVFAANIFTGTSALRDISGFGFSPDLVLSKQYSTSSALNTYAFDRVRGVRRYMLATTNAIDTGDNTSIVGYTQDGIQVGAGVPNNAQFSNYMFKRAPGFLDIVAWSGDGTNALRQISHSLKAMPELIICKNRSGAVANWQVTNRDFGLIWNSNSAKQLTGSIYGYATDAYFTPLAAGVESTPNSSGVNYIAYLFASVPGVSKIGTYTGDGTTFQKIECGFAGAARFVMVKRADATGEWMVWDYAHTNQRTMLTSTASISNISDTTLTPLAGGFVVTQPAGSTSNINVSGAQYLFLAIS